MKTVKMLFVCAALGLGALWLAGCEWTTGGGVDTWNSSQLGTNAPDLSGTYRPVDSNSPYLVRAYSISTNSAQVTAEQLGVGDGTATFFSGLLAQVPIRSTLTIVVGGYRMTDPGSGGSLTVSPSDGTTATVNFSTRAWTISFAAPIAAGAQILADYQYNATTSWQGNSGKPICSMTVFQMGDRLQFIDNNNSRYDGYAGATVTEPTPSTPIHFAVNGVSQGYKVTIVGVFQNSAVDASFIEEGGVQGEFKGKK